MEKYHITTRTIYKKLITSIDMELSDLLVDDECASTILDKIEEHKCIFSESYVFESHKDICGVADGVRFKFDSLLTFSFDNSTLNIGVSVDEYDDGHRVKVEIAKNMDDHMVAIIHVYDVNGTSTTVCNMTNYIPWGSFKRANLKKVVSHDNR